MIRMIKAVFFDIDDTVYDYISADKVAIAALKSYCRRQFDLSDDDFGQYISAARHMADARTGEGCAATHNRLIRFQCMLEILKKPLFPHAYEMYRIYWDTLISSSKPEPGIRKLEHLKLGEFIDGIVTSEEAGEEKPAKKLFLLCAQKASARPCECVFVGDSLKNDICRLF